MNYKNENFSTQVAIGAIIIVAILTIAIMFVVGFSGNYSGPNAYGRDKGTIYKCTLNDLEQKKSPEERGRCIAMNEHRLPVPYKIIVRDLTPDVLEACSLDENCMDVESATEAD